jgi:hypothetical protein
MDKFKAQLFEMIEIALNDRGSEQHADTLVKQAWDDKRETRSEAVSPSMALYFAIKMNAGRVIIIRPRNSDPVWNPCAAPRPQGRGDCPA